MESWKGMEALIISGAPETEIGYIRALLDTRPGMRIVCADAGVHQLPRLGVQPDLVVGDFDSSALPDLNCELIRLVPEKDDTDTMHALQVVIDRGCTRVFLVCATGGRLDHLLSNLSLCEYAHTRGCDCRVLDAQNELSFLPPGTVTLRYNPQYRYFSIIPLDISLTGLTITGAKYEVQNADVSRTQMYTVSNEVAGPTAQITLGQGRAFLIQSHDRR